MIFWAPYMHEVEYSNIYMRWWVWWVFLYTLILYSVHFIFYLLHIIWQAKISSALPVWLNNTVPSPVWLSAHTWYQESNMICTAKSEVLNHPTGLSQSSRRTFPDGWGVTMSTGSINSSTAGTLRNEIDPVKEGNRSGGRRRESSPSTWSLLYIWSESDHLIRLKFAPLWLNRAPNPAWKLFPRMYCVCKIFSFLLHCPDPITPWLEILTDVGEAKVKKCSKMHDEARWHGGRIW